MNSLLNFVHQWDESQLKFFNIFIYENCTRVFWSYHTALSHNRKSLRHSEMWSYISLILQILINQKYSKKTSPLQNDQNTDLNLRKSEKNINIRAFKKICGHHKQWEKQTCNLLLYLECSCYKQIHKICLVKADLFHVSTLSVTVKKPN